MGLCCHPNVSISLNVLDIWMDGFDLHMEVMEQEGGAGLQWDTPGPLPAGNPFFGNSSSSPIHHGGF